MSRQKMGESRSYINVILKDFDVLLVSNDGKGATSACMLKEVILT